MATIASIAKAPGTLPADPAAIDRALALAESGGEISREDSIVLLAHAQTGALLEAASSLRTRVKGRTISYSRKAFLPLTTFCRDYCGYCTFRRDPGEPGAHFMTPEEVLAAANDKAVSQRVRGAVVEMGKAFPAPC